MTSLRASSLAVLWLVAAGCGEIKEADYAGRYAEAICDAYEECARSYFLENYSDQEDCVDEFEDSYSGDDVYDGCEYDPEAARDCIDSLREFQRTCEYRDIDDDCERVWDCEGKTRTTYYGEYGYYDTGRRSASEGCSFDLSFLSGLSFVLFLPLVRRRRPSEV